MSRIGRGFETSSVNPLDALVGAVLMETKQGNITHSKADSAFEGFETFAEYDTTLNTLDLNRISLPLRVKLVAYNHGVTRLSLRKHAQRTPRNVSCTSHT